MINSDLRAALEALGTTQSDFARLVGVTPRAITLWLAGERTIPGSVEAYLRLLLSLTASQRQTEFARLNERTTAMREGMYGIEFSYRGNRGVGALVFQEGKVFGADEVGVKFDGDYVVNEAHDLMDVKLKVTFPPNVEAVFGTINPYEWAIDVTTSFDPRQDAGGMKIKTSVGVQVDGKFRFLRSIPEN